LHELLVKVTETGAIPVLLNAMQGLSGDIIDSPTAVTLLIQTGRHDFALGAPQGPTTQDTRQEVQINFILKVKPDFSVFRLFFFIFPGVLLFDGIGDLDWRC
jgi:hypothetical protein